MLSRKLHFLDQGSEAFWGPGRVWEAETQAARVDAVIDMKAANDLAEKDSEEATQPLETTEAGEGGREPPAKKPRNLP